MPRFRTTFNGYAVKWSPFVEHRLAVATAQNFGIIGNGRLHILEVRGVRTAPGWQCCGDVLVHALSTRALHTAHTALMGHTTTTTTTTS
jgi:hypothetical protein